MTAALHFYDPAASKTGLGCDTPALIREIAWHV